MEIGDSGGTKVAQEKTELKTPSLAEELDNLMDISIEIASNKRMKKDYIKPFKLTFKDKDLEKKVSFFQKKDFHLNHYIWFFAVLPPKGLHFQIQSVLCRGCVAVSCPE